MAVVLSVVIWKGGFIGAFENFSFPDKTSFLKRLVKYTNHFKFHM